MNHLDLFSGIGGFALATEMVWDNVEHIFCDNEPFSQAILKKHWPNSKIYGDIRTLTADAESGMGSFGKPSERPKRLQQTYELLTGGFPCQPFSQAGRRLGTEDDRHLWPEMLRVIQEFHPRWVIAENVGGFVTWSEGLVLEQVHADLESEGYEVQSCIIPAVSLNAPHRRDRVWIVAHSNHNGFDSGKPPSNSCFSSKTQKGQKEVRFSRKGNTNGNASDTPFFIEERAKQKGNGRGRPERQDRNTHWDTNWVEVAARLCTVDDGLPGELARPRGWRNAALKGAGNAIVPQVAAEIMQAIKEIDESL